jgi:hypothetical protein
MIFVINNLKYDTEKMELVSDKCHYTWTKKLFCSSMEFDGKDVKLYKSKKGNYLLVFKKDYDITCGRAISEEKAKNLLMDYDLEVYEKLFGELEEA